MIFGLRAVIEAANSGKDLEKVFIQKNISGDLSRELRQALFQTQTPILNVPIERINKFTRKNHQGVVAFLSPIKYFKLSDLVTRVFESGEIPFFLVLDRLTDVRNFGAIARTASCTGSHGIIIPLKGAAQVNGDAMKTSAGALNSLPVCRESNLKSSVEYLKNSGLAIVACTEKASEDISKASFKEPTALILGSEEDGISDELLKLCDYKFRIPITGPIKSLNVSSAAAMVCYEVLKQRT